MPKFCRIAIGTMSMPKEAERPKDELTVEAVREMIVNAHVGSYISCGVEKYTLNLTDDQ